MRLNIYLELLRDNFLFLGRSINIETSISKDS